MKSLSCRRRKAVLPGGLPGEETLPLPKLRKQTLDTAIIERDQRPESSVEGKHPAKTAGQAGAIQFHGRRSSILFAG